MNRNQKKAKGSGNYTRYMLGLIDKYLVATGKSPDCIDMKDVAFWAYKGKLWEPPDMDVVKQLASELSRAARQDYILDEDNLPVRRLHAFKEKRGEEQLTFWFAIDEGTPEKWKFTTGWRRRGVLQDILQLDRDNRYWNKNVNPGDPIGLDYDFNPDVEENRLPTEYPDAPPEGED